MIIRAWKLNNIKLNTNNYKIISVNMQANIKLKYPIPILINYNEKSR